MILRSIDILNYKNIREAHLSFSENINCFVGLNGQGKTNLLDAIYLLSFTKSAFTQQDSACITYGEQLAMVKGTYSNQEQFTNSLILEENKSTHSPILEDRETRTFEHSGQEEILVSCGLKVGVKKQFRWGPKDYKRLIDHIGRIPCVMVSPKDSELIAEGSDERRRFMDSVISQQDRTYLEHLTNYNALLKQRNALLKQLADNGTNITSEALNATPSQINRSSGLLEIYEQQMLVPATYIYEARTRFISAFVPIFQSLYNEISGGHETVSLEYVSQLQNRELSEAWVRTRERDLILGWTSQGIHKDDILMQIQLPGTSPEGWRDALNDHHEEKFGGIKSFGSQGQQKTYLLAMKLAQALYLGTPILLLDDIFDKLDAERVERIVRLVRSDRFGQIFITDTDRQHLTQLLDGDTNSRIFHVHEGEIKL